MSRTKDQWLAETGGFRLGESAAQFQARVAEVQAIRSKPALSAADIERLAELAGLDGDADDDL
ncbi:hypothetical protein [Caulobacter soli]|uniref:hypothetical protein n=1 Tax=Caulobacter soli TaxID=2708539 RepID=UPI0013E9D1F8|nr:hypothetical protein [Caulobacter soli]